jgi:hypothetical protein
MQIAEKIKKAPTLKSDSDRILDAADPKNNWLFKHKLYSVGEAKQLIREHVLSLENENN